MLKHAVHEERQGMPLIIKTDLNYTYVYALGTYMQKHKNG